MDDTALTLLTVLSLLVAVVALAVAVTARRATTGTRRGRRPSELPTDVAGLRAEVERLREESARAVRRLGVVRYDAFDDMGGRLSWSLALLDDGGSGVVLTSIHGRSQARSYAKNVTDWTSDQPLSPEEEQALDRARGS